MKKNVIFVLLAFIAMGLNKVYSMGSVVSGSANRVIGYANQAVGDVADHLEDMNNPMANYAGEKINSAGHALYGQYGWEDGADQYHRRAENQFEKTRLGRGILKRRENAAKRLESMRRGLYHARFAGERLLNKDVQGFVEHAGQTGLGRFSKRMRNGLNNRWKRFSNNAKWAWRHPKEYAAERAHSALGHFDRVGTRLATAGNRLNKKLGRAYNRLKNFRRNLRDTYRHSRMANGVGYLQSGVQSVRNKMKNATRRFPNPFARHQRVR